MLPHRKVTVNIYRDLICNLASFDTLIYSRPFKREILVSVWVNYWLASI
jgi:hypothetical protein